MLVALFGVLFGYFEWFGRDAVCELESETLFGHISWKHQLIVNNERFINAKPPDYMVGEVGINKTDSVNPWDEIYPTTWVSFPKPSIGGVQGWGMKMKHVAANPDEWKEESEGFGVAVMHQVHCVAVVKHALLTYEETGKSNADQVHLHHCVETLRQAVMCHGDMTLEHPEIDNAHDVILTGWGNTHLCRDWESVVTAISKHAIKHKAEGWARFEEGELKTIRGL
ncbi:hypothetical protein F5883DRAFT_654254 [Diaporthe sp. PMI_573]|nr:hypothetical protein F5883DRAFT_654254 [Diaporthaceae sp. PMI_573]